MRRDSFRVEILVILRSWLILVLSLDSPQLSRKFSKKTFPSRIEVASFSIIKKNIVNYDVNKINISNVRNERTACLTCSMQHMRDSSDHLYCGLLSQNFSSLFLLLLLNDFFTRKYQNIRKKNPLRNVINTSSEYTRGWVCGDHTAQLIHEFFQEIKTLHILVRSLSGTRKV